MKEVRKVEFEDIETMIRAVIFYVPSENIHAGFYLKNQELCYFYFGVSKEVFYCKKKLEHYYYSYDVEYDELKKVKRGEMIRGEKYIVFFEVKNDNII